METNSKVDQETETSKTLRSISQIKLNKNRVKVRLSEYKDHREEEIIGGKVTYLALKDPSTYMIATYGRGLKVILNNTQIYSAKLPRKVALINQILYAGHLDCFFLQNESHLYRKDLDDQPPYIYMDMSHLGWFRSLIRYSSVNKKLITFKDNTWISVINLFTRKVELQIEKKSRSQIMDCKLLGELEDKILSLTWNGVILLHIVNYSIKKVLVSNLHQIQLVVHRQEYGASIAVCDKNEHILVEIEGFNQIASRMFVFKINGSEIAPKIIIENYELAEGPKYALQCAGNFGDDILWVGLSTGNSIVAKVYCYCVRTDTLEQMNLAGFSEQKRCYDIHRFGQDFYFSGLLGKIEKLSLTI